MDKESQRESLEDLNAKNIIVYPQGHFATLFNIFKFEDKLRY